MANLKLVILNNAIVPYRIPIYRALSECFESRVLISGVEDNRDWSESSLAEGLDVRHPWGVTLKMKVRSHDGGISDLRYLHINPGLLGALLGWRPDALISTEMGFRSLVALGYAMVFHTPLWIWWGGTLATEAHRHRIKSFMRRYVFARFTPYWISYGSASTEYLRSIGVNQDRILQIQNCVDESLFPPSNRKYTYPDSRTRNGLFVGQLIRRKGIYELLDSIYRVQSKGIEVGLTIIGTGPERSQIEKRIKELSIRNIELRGYVPVEEMSLAYTNADFLIFPTLEEVWGLVVNEAILVGLPVACSIHAGCARDIVNSSSTFDPSLPHSIDDILIRAASGKLELSSPRNLLSIGEVCDRLVTDINERSHLARYNGVRTRIRQRLRQIHRRS